MFHRVLRWTKDNIAHLSQGFRNLRHAYDFCTLFQPDELLMSFKNVKCNTEQNYPTTGVLGVMIKQL